MSEITSVVHAKLGMAEVPTRGLDYYLARGWEVAPEPEPPTDGDQADGESGESTPAGDAPAPETPAPRAAKKPGQRATTTNKER